MCLLVCMYTVYMQDLTDVRRWCQMPWNWSYIDGCKMPNMDPESQTQVL